jgi:hypothetical protein
VSRAGGSGRAGGGLRELLFPPSPRRFRGARAWQIGARTVHIAAMALVVGGVACGLPGRELVAPIALTVASGLALLGIDLWGTCATLAEGRGIALMAKLALLGVGVLLASVRLEAHLAAIAVASVGSHMPKTWRHWSCVGRRGEG